MATTRIISMHARNNESIATSLGLRTDYIKNPEKTEQGHYLSSYECDPKTVNEEFMLVRQLYDRNHSSRFGKSDVIAYQIRQAFAPGEITPELANKLGYELAMRFTKGKHQFIVATHTDKEHIHNHIIYNSVALDSSKKFRDFLGSGRAVRKISDIICLEHNLSIIKEPKRGNHTYGKWLGEHKKPSNRDYIRMGIDEALNRNPKSMDELFDVLRESYNIEVDNSGKYIKFRCEGQKQFARINSLGDGYRQKNLDEKIRGIYVGRKVKEINSLTLVKDKQVSLLIDVQKKIAEGKGKGYERWAKTFNMKQTAKTLSFLSELGVNSLEELDTKHHELYDAYETLRLKLKEIDLKVERVRTVQNAIVTYAKTREAYQKYKKSGYSRKVREQLNAEILAHEEARKTFNEFKDEPIPKMEVLKEEYVRLKKEKSDLYKEYQRARRDYTEFAVAKKNVEIIIDRDHDGVHDFMEIDEHEHDR